MPAYTGHERWDAFTEQTAMTSNPAAGVLSVDVKTFTGRGRVSSVYCNCVADANAATRRLLVYKVAAVGATIIGGGSTFVASATGELLVCRGWGTIYAMPSGLADVDFAPGDILRVLVLSGQAGDDITAITYSFKEML